METKLYGSPHELNKGHEVYAIGNIADMGYLFLATKDENEEAPSAGYSNIKCNKEVINSTAT